MSALRRSLCLVLGLTAAGCSTSSLLDDEPVLVGDDAGGPVAEAPVPIVPPAKVGDSFADGRVVQVSTPSPKCAMLVVEKPAKWECSDALIAQARGTGFNGGGVAAPQYEPPNPLDQNKAVALEQATCASLAALRRAPLKQQLLAQIDSARRAQLANCLPTSSTHYFDAQGKETGYCSSPYGYADAGVGLSGGGAFTGGGVAGGGGASEYSTTNTQTVGVDEADFVKNDAQYVYVLSATGLHVIDAWPVQDSHEVNYLKLPGQPTRLFLSGDKLVVYTRVGAGGSSLPSGAQTCTYGYDCRFGAEPGQTLVKVYDVANPAAPRELVQYELSGGYVASRRVGANVYTVVFERPGVAAPAVDTSIPSSGPAELESNYAAAVKLAGERVDQLEDGYFLPWVEQRRPDNTLASKINSCDQALVAQSASGASLTSLVSFNLDQLDAPQRTLVASKAGFVYSSAHALYMATEGENGADNSYFSHSANERSSIHKFALEGAATRYVGSASIRGHVLNQFAMDEQSDILRVATTSGQVPAPDVSSNVTTLGVTNGSLGVLGELTGLAPTEDIRSVRFDGNRGFVVTFKKTDPLFVIDLSQTTPRVLGELKIPGFSTYMHPMDATHLLAIGLDADDKGSFAYFNGIQLQIFDISQLSAPKLLHKTTIGTRGSASDALTNHLAFNYFAAKSLLALPMTVCEGGGNGSFGDRLTFSGLMVFDVSLEKGINERGRMPFVSAEESAAVANCGSWWTGSSSAVKRSIIMDNYAIGISDTFYKASSIDALDRPLANLSITK
jgi:uncharacterized secreted protein with C-terminal beta-propeller domain